MGLFDRIILTIYTFALTFLSAAFVALAAGWLYPLAYVEAVLTTPQGRWGVGVAGAVFFVASVRLLYFAFRRRGGRRSITHDGPLGQVRVSLDAVEALAGRVAREVRGVREAKAVAYAQEDGLDLNLRLWTWSDLNIPEASDLLQRELARQVRQVLGVEVRRINLHVVNIGGARRSRPE